MQLPGQWSSPRLQLSSPSSLSRLSSSLQSGTDDRARITDAGRGRILGTLSIQFNFLSRGGKGEKKHRKRKETVLNNLSAEDLFEPGKRAPWSVESRKKAGELEEERRGFT